MTNKYTYTNEEWVAMVVAYNKDKSEEAFMTLYNNLKPVANRIGNSLAEKNKGYGIPAADFVNEAEFSIWKLTEVYDVEKGGSVPSMLKQLATWAVSDNLLRPLKSQQRTFEKEALYAAATFEAKDFESMGIYGCSILDSVADPKADFSEAILEEESENLYSVVTELIEDFSEEHSADDSLIVTEIFNLLQREPEASKKAVNSLLTELFPEVKSAALRKKKQRALDRFTAFCVENGYNSFDMSQF